MINILRHGVALFDRDLFDPLQYLLEIGRIRPTREAVHNYMARSQTLLEETDKHIQNSILDLYYSLIDMVHATLMVHGITPPSPKEMPQIFEKTFKKNKKLSVYSKDIKDAYDCAKQVEHNRKKFTGSELDKMKKKISKIILELKVIIEKEIDGKDMFEL